MDENREIMKDFREHDAIIQTNNDQLAKDMTLLIENDTKRTSLGNAARMTMAKNQGALDIVIEEISPFLSL